MIWEFYWNGLKWFKLDTEKFQLMALSEKIYCKPTVVINSKLVHSSDDVILLVIKIDEKLTFS